MSNIKLQTYNQSQHGVSTDEISPAARAIITKLIDNGFSAYIVGGAVRDLLLDKRPKDFDIATDATPNEIKTVFNRDCRIIGRRFQLAHVYYNRERFEVATFRGVSADGERVVKQGHIISDNVFGSINQDALRRDFTCNALYFDIENANILDYCGGVNDIEKHKLSFIGNDAKRIIEDPIRMIRAIRFQSKLGLNISTETKQVMIKQHKTLANVSMARLFDELIKLFHNGSALNAYQLMHELLLFQYIFPQVSKKLNDSKQNRDFIRSALMSTDLRIEQNKSVTPIFLFACFLWPLAIAKTNTYIAKEINQYDAINKAANWVFNLTRKTIAIPKMIQIGIRHIWILQNRFHFIKGKKAMFTLDHPRFRAAYDFLLLRANESEEIKGLGIWWTDIQTHSRTNQKNIIFPKKATKIFKPKTCYLGLGSNIGNCQENIEQAIRQISKTKGIQLNRSASFYLTKAWGNTNQQDFTNTVIEIETTLKGLDLMRKMQAIETSLGRKKIEKWGPRIIDIDILVYGSDVIKNTHLTIPHPHIAERSFVLAPLYELNPKLSIPNLGKIVNFIDEKQLKFDIIEIISGTNTT